ncbi:MAG: hypothetical protein HY885_01865 [Deltaproteobacteria bacterium]|nr:hypothetical protein [Deltaproteobacteria bacterium]
MKQIKGMSGMESGDPEENAIKYLALAIMHTVSEKAKKLSLKRKGDKLTVKVKGEEETTLPPPSLEQFNRILAIMRAILHIEEESGKLPLALGLRNGELELQVEVSRGEDKETLKIKFPDL